MGQQQGWPGDDSLYPRQIRRASGQGKKSCGEKAVILMAFLGGLAWAFSEVVSRVA